MDNYTWKSKVSHNPSRYFDHKGIFSVYLYDMEERNVQRSNSARFESKSKLKTIELLNDIGYINHYYYSKELDFVPIAMCPNTKKPVSKGWNNFNLKTYDGYAFGNDSNLAILTGKPSMIFVLDIDVPKEGETDGLEFLDYCMEKSKGYGRIYEPDRHYANTMVQRSGGGGYHFFYMYEPAFDLIRTVARNALTIGDKKYSIDIKNNGGNITFTPSMHKSGNKYRLLDEFKGVKTTNFPNTMPRWLLYAIMTTLQRNNHNFVSIKHDLIATYDANGNIQTPSDKINKKPTVHQNTRLIDDNVEKIARLINTDRWVDFETWRSMVFGLKNLSIKSGNPKRYYNLCHELSNTCAEKYEYGGKEKIDEIWDEDNKDRVNIGTFLYWLKQDVTKEVYRSILNEIGAFKVTGKYSWNDATKLHNKDYQNPSDRNDIFDFIRSCIFPIRSSKEGLTYAIKDKEFDVDYGKEYYTYNSLSPSQLQSHLKLIKIKNALKVENKKGEVEYKDKSLMYLVENSSIEHHFSKLAFEPYSAISDRKNVDKSRDKFNTLNMFTGFCNEYDPNFIVDMNKIKPALNQINEFCSNHKGHADFFVTWLAHMVQYPDAKTGVMTVIKSNDQGTGKTTFFNWFGSTVISKQYYASISDIGKVTGRFNSSVAGKLLIVLEEIDCFEGDRAINAELKNIITNTDQMIEFKGREPIRIKSLSNYVILTNKDNVVKVEGGDRRYFLLECKRIRPTNDPHWKFMNEDYYKDPSTSLHFYHYLMRIKDVKSNIKNIPITNIKARAKRDNSPPVVEFLFNEYIREFHDNESTETSLTYTVNALLDGVNGVLIDRGHSKPSNKRTIGKDIGNEFNKESYRVNDSGKKISMYTFTKAEMEKAFKHNEFYIDEELDIQ